MIDTGASKNFIKPGLLRPTGKKPQALLADGKTSLPTKGTARATITIGTASFHQEFIVCESLGADVFLGYEFLRGEDATLDLSRGCVHIGKEERQTIFFHPQRQPTKTKTTRIPTHGFERDCADRFESVCRDFQNTLYGRHIGSAKSAVHHIHLTDERPFCLRPYQCSQVKKQQIREQVEEMLAQGIIEPSKSPYCSPVLLVKKKNGTNRFCVDFRRLNSQTRDEAAPLPLITDAIQNFGSAKIFSTLDLCSGYWQIPVHPHDKHYTAFATHDGATYQFKVMPFGLKTAPATFQKMMVEVLRGLEGFTTVYLDDIVVFSESPEEHVSHLRRVLERLQEHGLGCSAEKCQFARNEVSYLGHKITIRGNLPESRHLDAIVAFPTPTTKKELRRFLGVCGWLRDHIPRFSEKTAPLTSLLQKNMPFVWDAEKEEAFRQLKTELTAPITLSRPDFKRKFTLQTDASGTGIAAVLYQEDEGQRRIISFGSAKLTETQRRYHINEQECLAIIWAVKRYRHLLEDRRFTLRTDSKALTWLNTARESTPKLTRWSILLQEFSFDVEHCAGEANELADLLSRDATEEGREEEEFEGAEKMLPPEDTPMTANLITTGSRIEEEVGHAQTADVWVQRRKTELQDDPERHRRWTLEGEHLLLRGLFYVPGKARKKVLEEFHGGTHSGHPGEEETSRAIQQHFTWPGLRKDVSKWIISCRTCASVKRGALEPKPPMLSHAPSRPFQTVSVDIMGPYDTDRRGYAYILVITDVFTKWTEAFPMKTARAPRITKLLEDEVFMRYGYPQTVITDNGSQFTAQTFRRKLAELEIRHQTTAVFHPRANPVERKNQDLKKNLRALLLEKPDKNWSELLPLASFQLRTRSNAATGHTPSEALFGYPLRLPGGATLRKTDKRTPEERRAGILQRSRKYGKRYTDKFLKDAPEIKAGDEVMVRNRQKGLNPVWIGPRKILAAVGGNCFWVEGKTPDQPPTKLHRLDLRPAPPPRTEEAIPDSDQDPPTPPPPPEEPGPPTSAPPEEPGPSTSAPPEEPGPSTSAPKPQ